MPDFMKIGMALLLVGAIVMALGLLFNMSKM